MHRRIRLPSGCLIFGRRGELSSSPDDKIDSNTNNRRYSLRSDPNVILVPPLHTDRRVGNRATLSSTVLSCYEGKKHLVIKLRTKYLTTFISLEAWTPTFINIMF
jgi:hypothetical protein